MHTVHLRVWLIWTSWHEMAMAWPQHQPWHFSYSGMQWEQFVCVRVYARQSTLCNDGISAFVWSWHKSHIWFAFCIWKVKLLSISRVTSWQPNKIGTLPWTLCDRIRWVDLRWIFGYIVSLCCPRSRVPPCSLTGATTTLSLEGEHITTTPKTLPPYRTFNES